MIFIDRQMLLATLFENLRNKDKVITGAEVQTVITIHGGVEVATTDGQTFKGDLLVGADGVYSAVRQEMWRLVGETKTEHFPKKDWEGKVSNLPLDEYCYLSER
jgi:2-polyprenyl-6-methoxyphenol hydroxylase-like FAD-dependent oxidoreductase